MGHDAKARAFLDVAGRFLVAALVAASVSFAAACGEGSADSQPIAGESGAGGIGLGPSAGAGGFGAPPTTAGVGATGGAIIPAPSAGIGNTPPAVGPATGGTNAQPPSGGTDAQPPSGGTDAQPPSGGTDAQPPSGGTDAQPPPGGTDAQPPMAGANSGPPPEPGSCCPDGDCICRNPDPSDTSFAIMGPFQQEMYPGETGNIYYPLDAEAPFAGVAVCGGFTNTGVLMQGWGPFYASWGIVTIITWTGGGDQPATRGRKLLASIAELKAENENSSSPLFGKMSDRFGISGYSMGGGGTTMGTRDDPSLKTGIGLAPWSPVSGMTVPTLFLVGDADFVAGAQMPRTASGTPSLQVVFGLYSHFNWFGPDTLTGHYALAWQKMYLEGDTRWEPWLSQQLTGVASMTAN